MVVTILHQRATAIFIPTVVGGVPSSEEDIVTASVMIPGSDSGTSTTIKQTFYLTSMPLNTTYCGKPPCNPPVSPVLAQVIQPAAGTAFTGPAGSTLPNPVLVQVFSGANLRALPNVGVKVSTGTSPGAPNASCAGTYGGLALTDATGTATCNVV